MQDREKEDRILAANPVLGRADFRSELRRWEAIQQAGMLQGLVPGSNALGEWTAYWMTGGREGRLP